MVVKSTPSLLSQTTVSKYCKVGSLHNRNVFLTVLEAEKCVIKGSTDLISGEEFFLAYRS